MGSFGPVDGAAADGGLDPGRLVFKAARDRGGFAACVVGFPTGDGGGWSFGFVLLPAADRGLGPRGLVFAPTADGRVDRGRDVEATAGDRGVLRAAALTGDALGERQGFTGGRGEVVTAPGDRGEKVVGEVERAAGDGGVLSLDVNRGVFLGRIRAGRGFFTWFVGAEPPCSASEVGALDRVLEGAACGLRYWRAAAVCLRRKRLRKNLLTGSGRMGPFATPGILTDL